MTTTVLPDSVANSGRSGRLASGLSYRPLSVPFEDIMVVLPGASEGIIHNRNFFLSYDPEE